eukprot:gene15528-17113_t
MPMCQVYGKHHTAIHGIQIHRNNDANSNAYHSRNSNQHRQPPSQAHSHVVVVSNESAPPSLNQDSPTLQYTAANCASIAPPSVPISTNVNNPTVVEQTLTSSTASVISEYTNVNSPPDAGDTVQFPKMFAVLHATWPKFLVFVPCKSSTMARNWVLV